MLAAELGGSSQVPVDNDPNPTWSSFSLRDLPGGPMGWEREIGGKRAAPALAPVRKEGWIFKNASGCSWKAAAGVCGAVGYGAASGEPKLLVELVLSSPWGLCPVIGIGGEQQTLQCRGKLSHYPSTREGLEVFQRFSVSPSWCRAGRCAGRAQEDKQGR